MLSFVSDIVWGLPLGALILGTGVFLTVKLRFFQITNLFLWLKNTVFSLGKAKKLQEKSEISPFRAVCSSLAATVGTGNITGVATAISTGGAGAVFWMWVAAFFGMATKFSENLLGVYFRRKNEKGEWSGGAALYLRYGPLPKKIGRLLSALFSLFCMTASFGIGNTVQANNIATVSVSLFCLPESFSSLLIIGLLLSLSVFLCLKGGISRVGAVCERIVPFMALFYVGGCLFIIFTHLDSLLAAVSSVFSEAFSLRPIVGGGIGTVVRTGIKRGVFSNEAGLASSATVSSLSSAKEPVEQGMWGIFEVFADTFVICSLTAFVILLSDPVGQGTDLVVSAFSSSMGNLAAVFVSVSSLFFSFSTILGWSQYGIKSCETLFGVSSVSVFRVIFSAFTAVGTVVPLTAAWDVSDIFNGLMALPNLIGLVFLAPTVRRVTENYLLRKVSGRTDISPDISNNFQKSARFS